MDPRLDAALSLLRWLGPWADPTRAPRFVARREIASATGRVWVYLPSRRTVRGSVVFVHGINPWGPADPRCDRLLRVLAGAGLLVVAPFLTDSIALRIGPGGAREVRSALEACTGLAEHPPGSRPALFSVSVGSLPALLVAAASETAGAIGGVLCYGGFGDPRAALTYAAGIGGGRDLPAPDPLIRPALALNWVPETDSVTRAARTAWRSFIEATWGHADMESRWQHEPLALELAGALEPGARALFLRGCGLSDDAADFFRRSLSAAGDLSELDVRPHLRRVRAPVRLMHALHDRVIPHTELDELRTAFPDTADVRCYRTGLFGHSGPRSFAELLGAAPRIVREARSFLGMVAALVELGFGPERRFARATR